MLFWNTGGRKLRTTLALTRDTSPLLARRVELPNVSTQCRNCRSYGKSIERRLFLCTYTSKIHLDREQESNGRRVFSKIFKLEENNQYGFAMTKPLPIGTFKRKKEANMEILNEAIEHNTLIPTPKLERFFSRHRVRWL